MALKHLSLAEMVSLTHSWLAHDAAALHAVPELAGLLPRITAAHTAALSATHLQDRSGSDGKHLSDEEAAADLLHDNALRALYYGLTAAACLQRARGTADALAKATELEALRDRLLPGGLAMTQQSYSAEHGAALQLAEALDADTKSALRAVRIGEGDGVECVRVWIAQGKRLGELEAQRLAKSKDGPAIAAARARWTSAVALVLDVLAGVEDNDDKVAALRDPVNTKSAEAAGRYSAVAADAPAPEAPAAGAVAPKPAS